MAGFGVFRGLLLLAALLRSLAGKSTTGGSKSCAHTGFFSKQVVPLCANHFPDETSKHSWVIVYYHPGIKGVFDSREVFEQLAAEPKKLEGAKVGAVDCAHNGEFCAKNGIRSVPTTVARYHGRSRDFEGETTLENIRAFVKDSLKRFKEMEEALKCDVKGLFLDGNKDSALPLCTRSFPPVPEPVPWIVAFYEKGDRNKDKTMKSVMNKIAEKYGNRPPKKVDSKQKKPLKIRVGAVDCGHSSNDCEKFGVSTLPALRFYGPGPEPNAFDSFIDSDEIKQWADAQLKAMPTPEPAEVLKADEAEKDAAPKEDL